MSKRETRSQSRKSCDLLVPLFSNWGGKTQRKESHKEKGLSVFSTEPTQSSTIVGGKKQQEHLLCKEILKSKERTGKRFQMRSKP